LKYCGVGSCPLASFCIDGTETSASVGQSSQEMPQFKQLIVFNTRTSVPSSFCFRIEINDIFGIRDCSLVWTRWLSAQRNNSGLKHREGNVVTHRAVGKIVEVQRNWFCGRQSRPNRPWKKFAKLSQGKYVTSLRSL
jgi:hypothetical protein